MARRKKGRDISGWLVVDKPAGITSTAVVNKVRWALDAKKAGHAGTLDPEATGVLAIALGEATKTVPYITDALKAYRFTVRLGQATNTDDAEGEVIAESAERPGDEEIKAALGGFIGEIMQVPPKFSAVKIDGQRAYKLAREGEDFEVAARPLWVEELLLTDRPDVDHVELVVNYELPENSELLTHRVGRTGRMGREGFAYTLIGDEDGKKWNKLKRDFGKNVRTRRWSAR